MKNYYQLDNALIDHFLSTIGTTGLAVYSVLKRHMNGDTRQCFPSQKYLAEKCHCDKRTVIRALKVLEVNHLITVRRAPRKPNVYYLNHVSRLGVDMSPSLHGIILKCPECGLQAVRKVDSFVCPKCLIDVGQYVEDVLTCSFPELSHKNIFESKKERDFSAKDDSYYENIHKDGDTYPPVPVSSPQDVFIDFMERKCA